MVKNFGGKKGLAKRLLCKDWRKNFWRMLTCIANHQSKINSKMKQFQTIAIPSFAHVARPPFGACMQSIITCNISARTKR